MKVVTMTYVSKFCAIVVFINMVIFATESFDKKVFFDMCQEGDIKAVQIMLSDTIDPNMQDQYGSTPLIKAAQKGHLEIVQLLLNFKADPNLYDNSHRTPLIESLRNNHVGIAQLLIEHNADVNAQDDYRRRPLSVAVDTQQIALVNTLLARNADIDIQDHEGYGLLVKAVDKRNAQIVALFLKYNAQVALKDNTGTISLIKAACLGCADIVRLLIEYNVDIGAQDKYGSTALIGAVKNRQLGIVELLLKHNSEAALKNGAGNISLINAIHNGCYDNYLPIVKLLLEYGVDVNAYDKHGNVAISSALRDNAPLFDGGQILKLLLDYGADIDIKDQFDQTSLMRAVHQGNWQKVMLLLGYGANVDLLFERYYSSEILETYEGDEVIVNENIIFSSDEDTQESDDISDNGVGDEFSTQEYLPILNSLKVNAYSEFLNEMNFIKDDTTKNILIAVIALDDNDFSTAFEEKCSEFTESLAKRSLRTNNKAALYFIEDNYLHILKDVYQDQWFKNYAINSGQESRVRHKEKFYNNLLKTCIDKKLSDLVINTQD